jgi:energy-coupling factor transport system substrate-specific component
MQEYRSNAIKEKEWSGMRKGLTGKKVLFTIIGIAAYMMTVFLCEFLGYVSPALWVFATAVAAIPGAIAAVYLMQLWRKFGALTLVGVLWALLMFVGGEVWTAIIPVWCIAVAVFADIVRAAWGMNNRNAMRISYPIFALMPFGQFISLWLHTDTYAAMAAEEMGTEGYAAGLTAFATPVGLIGVLAAILMCGAVGERIAEVIWKKKIADMK